MKDSWLCVCCKQPDLISEVLTVASGQSNKERLTNRGSVVCVCVCMFAWWYMSLQYLTLWGPSPSGYAHKEASKTSGSKMISQQWPGPVTMETVHTVILLVSLSDNKQRWYCTERRWGGSGCVCVCVYMRLSAAETEQLHADSMAETWLRWKKRKEQRVFVIGHFNVWRTTAIANAYGSVRTLLPGSTLRVKSQWCRCKRSSI